MNKIFTHKKWLRLLLLVACCVATATAVHAANITVDGINYTTKNDGTATIAKYTIIKATADTPADTLFYSGDIVIPEKISYEGVRRPDLLVKPLCLTLGAKLLRQLLPQFGMRLRCRDAVEKRIVLARLRNVGMLRVVPEPDAVIRTFSN